MTILADEGIGISRMLLADGTDYATFTEYSMKIV
jgi:hypothetical protein